jgi:hypothetical protein
MPITFDGLLDFVRQHTALTETETQSLREKAQRPEYWTSLCEEMTIGSTASVVGEGSGVPAGIDDAISDYWEYGHCAVHDAFAVKDIERLRSAVSRVHQAGWPMIFAFVYDQFWTITRSPKMDAFVRGLLGPGYQPTISFWVNHVPAERGGSGFPPHRDDVRPGHHAATCWIPLTPATTENGCVYVVERDPAGQSAVAESSQKMQMGKTLLHVRALPANPGSFLAWPNDTLHWGGMFLRGQARMALSYHLTSSDYENVDSGLRLALMPSRPLQPFEQRLSWVSQSMLRFRARDPLLERFAPVAQYFAKASHPVAVDSHMTLPRSM